MKNWQNIYLLSLSENIDDIAKYVHAINDKMEVYINSLVSMNIMIIDIENDVSKLYI